MFRIKIIIIILYYYICDTPSSLSVSNIVSPEALNDISLIWSIGAAYDKKKVHYTRVCGVSQEVTQAWMF